MDLGARIGWGIVIYGVAYLAWSGMTIYGWSQGPVTYLVVVLALVIVCAWAGSQLKFRTWKDILPYSIGWAIIAIALDSIFAVPVQGWGLYTQWYAWLLYALIAILPLLPAFLRTRSIPHGSWES